MSRQCGGRDSRSGPSFARKGCRSRSARCQTLISEALYSSALCDRVCSARRSERLVFGSDYPLLGLPRYRQDMEAAGLTGDEIAAITATPRFAKLTPD